MPVKRTITGGASARLARVPLDCRLTVAQVCGLLADEPLPFSLSGNWAGGGAIAGSDPVRVGADADDPFELLDDVPEIEDASGSPPHGVGGGWFGWLGYRLAARVEDIPLTPHRPVPLPDFHLAYYDNVLRQEPDGQWWFEALVTAERRAALDVRLAHLRRRLASPPSRPSTASPPSPPTSAPPLTAPPGPLELRPDRAAHHLAAVRECRERIAAGEIFQANICLRLDAAFDGRPHELFSRALEQVTPPYAAIFDTPRGGIVSLSPELFLRRRGRHIVTGPIKGTIARDPDPAVAAAALQRLTSSVKDAAEHVMIVDLMRNDIGRVCEYGSVVAPRRPTPEPHPGLWHLVSHVHGRLRPGVGDRDVLRATFPPGSVTGAPKVQSLRVIAELEPVGREVYTGAIGFASPVAGLELNVAIRTVELRSGRLWLGAGGGIVADSDPARELEEALTKARPIAAAIGTSVLAGGSVAAGGSAPEPEPEPDRPHGAPLHLPSAA